MIAAGHKLQSMAQPAINNILSQPDKVSTAVNNLIDFSDNIGWTPTGTAPDSPGGAAGALLNPQNLEKVPGGLEDA